jgi:hypothetical protein
MDKSKLSPEKMLESCDEIDQDDGVSPQELAKRWQKQQHAGKSKRPLHRLMQLCRQVQHGIDDALWCDCADPLLSDLRTMDVKPIDGSSVLVATLITRETDPEVITLICDHLQMARGMIRASVAGVINRKRVPQIQFRVIPERRR